MQTWGIILLLLIGSSIPAYAQLPDGTNPITNLQVGGPIVPVGNSTMQQYCWNGTCITSPPAVNTTLFGNDTNREGLSHYNIIMIIPSEICTTAIKHNAKTNCPPLANLTKYDTSNQKISGYFYSMDGKKLERSNPQVKNHWQFYTYTHKTVVCVYCTGNYLTTDLYKTIIIEPDNFEYVKHGFISVNNTQYRYNGLTGNVTGFSFQTNELTAGLTTFLNRDVQGCNTATISYSDKLLNDTINYLENGCTKTNFNQTNTYKVPNTPWIYNNPYSTLHYKALTDKIRSNPPGNCITKKCYIQDNRWKW